MQSGRVDRNVRVRWNWGGCGAGKGKLKGVETAGRE